MLFGGSTSIKIRDVINSDPDGLYELGGDGSALSTIVSNAAVAIFTLSGLAVFIYLIWGGYEWLMAGEDKAKVEAARTRITNAVIGIAILASAWVIYSIIDKFFGIGNI